MVDILHHFVPQAYSIMYPELEGAAHVQNNGSDHPSVIIECAICVHVCLYLCVGSTCVYMCLCTCVYMCLYLCIHVSVPVCTCVSVLVCTCVSVRVCTSLHVPMCTRVCTYVCMCLYMCVHVPVCTCICVSVHMCLYLCVHVCLHRVPVPVSLRLYIDECTNNSMWLFYIQCLRSV